MYTDFSTDEKFLKNGAKIRREKTQVFWAVKNQKSLCLIFQHFK